MRGKFVSNSGQPPVLLTIAGSDSGGGAGVQGDLKTFQAWGGFGVSVITALTSQNTKGVGSVFAVAPAFIREQLDWVLSDMGAQATKVGMLFSVDVVRVVVESIRLHSLANVVCDPVMVAKSGDVLLQTDAILELKELLFPHVTLITPNLPEAELLCGFSIGDKVSMQRASTQLLEYAPAVLIKGGHLPAEEGIWDLLAQRNAIPQWFSSQRILTKNTHGTGCTLSSAIAAGLAYGEDLVVAVQKARTYVHEAILGAKNWSLGHGHGPLDHFWEYREEQ